MKEKKYGICEICEKELEKHGWVYKRPPKNIDFWYLFKKIPKYHIKCQRKELGNDTIFMRT